jgi:hypothetical protein
MELPGGLEWVGECVGGCECDMGWAYAHRGTMKVVPAVRELDCFERVACRFLQQGM